MNRESLGFFSPSAVKLVILYSWSCQKRDSEVGTVEEQRNNSEKKKVSVHHVKIKKKFELEGQPCCFS